MTRAAAAIAASIAVSACLHEGPKPAASSQPQPEGPPVLQLPRTVLPQRYRLALDIDPAKPAFSGRAIIEVKLAEPRDVIWLHGRKLAVSAASVETSAGKQDGKWEQLNEDGLAKITLPQAAPAGAATITIDWSAPFDDKLTGLYLAEEDGAAYASTQFEPDLARRAFPCFDDPQFKTPFEVTISAPEGQVVATGTPIAEEKSEGGKRVVRFEATRPLPTYLMLFAVGPFDVVSPPPLPPNDVRARPLQVRGLAPKGRGPELDYALKAGGEILAVLEKYFGREFPYQKLDHFAIPDFRSGAMENAGAITYREQALLFRKGVSGDDARVRIGSIMAHEMAHQWFGDLVTLPWWTDTWLNEAFATWMASRAMRTWDPSLGTDAQSLKTVQAAMASDELQAARAIRQPLERMSDVSNQFDNITYQKGAGVIAMFERWTGEDAFRAGVRKYIDAHADGSGSTDALLAALDEASGKEVTAAFRSFLDQPGVPLVQVDVQCEAGGAKLKLAQSRYFPVGSQGDASAQRWRIPICVRYSVDDTEKEACTLLADQSGELPLAGCPAWVLPNAGAAGYFHFTLPRAALEGLAQKGYGKLSLRERIALADAVRAGLRGGQVQFGDAVAIYQQMASDQDPEMASEPMGQLRFATEWLAGPHQDDARRFDGALYQPALQRLGWQAAPGESVGAGRLRRGVLEFLAHTAEDPAVRAEAARRGRALVEGGTLHLDAVDPGVSEIALQVAVEEDADGALFNSIEQLIPTVRDGTIRQRLIAALGATRSPERLERALHLALDGRLRANERTLPIATAFARRQTREAAWQWVRAHVEELAKKLPERQPGFLAGAAGRGFCDDDHLKELQQTFGPRVEQMQGMRRALRQSTEAMRVCIAQRRALSAGAQAFFEQRTAHAAQ